MNGAFNAGSPPFDKQTQVEQSLAEIREALLTLRFGAIAITVHDDRVVQIDVTEKKRLKPT
jgi:hypothetical protein